MSSLCKAAYENGTYDQIKSLEQVRKAVGFKPIKNESAEAKWWANERPKLRVYLVSECWDAKPGHLCVARNARSEMASRVWSRIPVELQEKIKNEMARISNLSFNVMRGE